MKSVNQLFPLLFAEISRVLPFLEQMLAIFCARINDETVVVIVVIGQCRPFYLNCTYQHVFVCLYRFSCSENVSFMRIGYGMKVKMERVLIRSRAVFTQLYQFVWRVLFYIHINPFNTYSHMDSMCAAF